MNYSQTLAYLYSNLPMFHRVGAPAYKASLDNTNAIMEILHHPHRNYITIHVAGTNGKGSTSHMLASILQHAGYRTGLYTSPHLKDFRERIRVNGEMVPKGYVTKFVNTHKNQVEKIAPSFFEWTVGLAFKYFEDAGVDVAVIETGLGGRLDSTNVIVPVLSVITNISMDHSNLLGNTLRKIAAEKAGIIKSGVPVVVGEHDHAVSSVFVSTAKKCNAPLYFASQDMVAKLSDVKRGKAMTADVYYKKQLILKNLKMELQGNYQLRNICTVLAAVRSLQWCFKITEKNIRHGVANVCNFTGLMGRWQVLSKAPFTVCDIAHNEEGIRQTMQQLKKTTYRHLHMVVGAVNDKDIEKMIQLMPQKNTTYYFCKPNIPRGLDATLLQHAAAKYRLHGNVYKSVKAAYAAALAAATRSDAIYIGGSTFVVAEVV